MQNLPFTVANARYSKGLLAVKPVSDGSIWKTPAAQLAEFFCTRYTHREGAYLLTPRAFDMLVWAYRNGYEASNISDRISKIHGSTVRLTRAEFAQFYTDNK